MNELAESVSLKKLLVLATIRETLEVSWQHRKVLALWVVGCTIFSGGFCYLIEYLSILPRSVNGNWYSPWLRVPLVFLGVCFSVLVPFMICARLSVYCHRLVLADQENASFVSFSFRKREWRFLGWDLLLVAGFLVIGVVVITVSALVLSFLGIFYEFHSNSTLLKAITDNYLFTVLFYGAGSYALAGYCLVLPATALDLKPSLAWSSEQTKGNELRLALLFGGLPFVFGFLYCPPSVLTWLQIDQLIIVKHVIRPFLVYLVTPIIVIAISIAFRELTNWTPFSGDERKVESNS